MKARRLSPAEAVERGRRLLAQRRAAEAWARRPAWTAPGVAETTEPRRSPPAPERWPRVWRGPTLIPAPTIVAAEVNATPEEVAEIAAKWRRSQAKVALLEPTDAGIPVTEQDQRVTPPSSPCSKLPEIEQPVSSSGDVAAAHPPGAWPIADLGPRQCRFACTPFDAPSHRFCGAPTKAGPRNLHGSWCEAHLPLVWGRGTEGERMADWTPKRVRVVG